jgi:hypothetical protein
MDAALTMSLPPRKVAEEGIVDVSISEVTRRTAGWHALARLLWGARISARIASFSVLQARDAPEGSDTYGPEAQLAAIQLDLDAGARLAESQWGVAFRRALSIIFLVSFSLRSCSARSLLQALSNSG